MQKEQALKGKTAIGCSDFKVCGFKVGFEVFGKKLTEKQIFDLIKKGKTSKLKGFTTHPENIDEGILCFNENFSLTL